MELDWKKKPVNVRYVDMAIYIDNHFYEEERDDETLFIYMYHLAKMLAYKKKYFKNINDYDGFAVYLATDVWQRMNKVRVKSVLNYMKSVLYFRKIGYEHETYSQMIDPEFDKQWDTSQYIAVNTEKLEAKNRERVIGLTKDIFALIPKYLKESIPKEYWGTVYFDNLYKSALLTLDDALTLPNSKLKSKDKNLEEKPNFNGAGYYRKQIKIEEPILWKVPKNMSDVVLLILNKTMNRLFTDLKDIIDDNKISEKEFKDISASAFDGAVTNE